MKKMYYGRVAIISLAALFLTLFLYGSLYAGDKPVVSTVNAKSQEDGAALIHGLINDEGGKEVSKYGFQWGESNELGKDLICTEAIAKDKSFSFQLKDLEPGHTYYYQAFAVNVKGSSYGELKSFTVPVNEAPMVSISVPGDKSRIIRGDKLSIKAAAKDDGKIELISLFINEELIHSLKGDALNYVWDTASLSPGEYQIKITAQDGRQEGYEQLVVKLEAKPETKTVAELQPAPQPPSQQQASKPATQNVSRSVGTSNTYKYPKLSKVQGAFGQFYYRDISGGRIEIDPKWVEANIVTITLPGLNQKVQVHKDAADNFIQAFTYIKNGKAKINGQEVPLLSLIKTMDGTWVSRHVNWSSSRGLSNHSWGIAIDINASDHFRYVNPSREPYDPNFILWEKAFKPAGFSWGNSYSDSMHFEILD
ncbi:MAG: M15 family metallopeptidase [Syntrophomonadaceae bacterium]|nr:M15 family metallopeptidase [Syntrophomonadaceae bacterium]